MLMSMDILWDDRKLFCNFSMQMDFGLLETAMASSTYLNYDVPDNGGQFDSII